MNKSDPLWLKGTLIAPGICDRILVTIKQWILIYDKGEVSAIRKQNQMRGKEMKVVDVVTRRACKVAWLQEDLSYLVKILEAKAPDWPVTKDFRMNFPKWRNGKLIAGGARVLEMDVYFQNVCEILAILEALRDGKFEQREKQQDLSTVDLENIGG